MMQHDQTSRLEEPWVDVAAIQRAMGQDHELCGKLAQAIEDGRIQQGKSRNTYWWPNHDGSITELSVKKAHPLQVLLNRIVKRQGIEDYRTERRLLIPAKASEKE